MTSVFVTETLWKSSRRIPGKGEGH